MNLQRDVEDIELDLLLEALHRGYGLDLRQHARASLSRRIGAFAAEEGVESLSELQARVLRDAACVERLSQRISVSVTGMFRDPGFYKHLREDVIPQLRTWPSVLAWVAGCASGEEAYSLAILLHEEGLGSRTRIHATDRSRALLSLARAGAYSLSSMKDHAANYRAAGGIGDFDDYFLRDGEHVTMREHLRRMVTFSIHDLATDGRFNEFQLVLCRNVLIYFQEDLKLKVLDLMHQSLVPFGVLALGTKESLRYLPVGSQWADLSAVWRTYRKLP